MGSSAELSPPALSVVIPVRNRPQAVLRAIDTVLADPAAVDLEVVVVDDGSTDDTAARVRSVADQRVRLVQQPARGVSEARNTGAGSARARFVAFVDSDDEVLPGWSAQLIAASCAGLDLWSCANIERHEGGRDEVIAPSQLGGAFGGLHGRFQAGCFGVSVAAFQRCGGYLPRLRHGENTALWMALGRSHLQTPLVTGFVDDALVVVHRRPRPYDATLYFESGSLTLSHFADMLRLDRRQYAAHLAITGESARRLGRRRQALGLLAQALGAAPLHPKHWARLVRAVVSRGRR
jgi:glycosyltransferase involved in cell wall biosynthesis